MNRYRAILLLIVVTAMLVTGCTKELLMDDLSTDRNRAMLFLSTRAGEPFTGSGNEFVVQTLRVMIFNSGGVQIANSYYGGASLDGLKNSDGNFSITERLPRDLGQIKVCLIANEPGSWGLGSTSNKVSYTMLNNLTIHYGDDFDFINNNGNSDDLNLYISPKDHFLMYVETSVNFVAGDVSIADLLPLKRTAAKVTLMLGYDQLSDVDYGKGEEFVLKSVSIQNQPIYSYFFAKPYDSEDFFSTAYVNLVYDSNTKVTRPVVFYIPEYYLSSIAFGNKLFTYIEVVGEYTSGVVKIPVIYKIPLGDGVQSIFTDNSYVPVISDYSIVRNHHYVVNGRITKLGEKEGIQAKISILPWKDGGNIDVEDPAPYLNISEIELKQNVSSRLPDVSDKLFFWSNQPQEQITLGAVTAAYYAQNDVEMDVSGFSADELPLINVNMTKYSLSGGVGSFFENNGHVTIDMKLPATITWHKLVVKFHVKAGNLKRLITITYTSM